MNTEKIHFPIEVTYFLYVLFILDMSVSYTVDVYPGSSQRIISSIAKNKKKSSKMKNS